VIHSFTGWGAQIAACEALRGLPELELACWYDDSDIAALGASPHLADLRVLVLWTERQPEFFEDTDLCRLAAQGTAWPNLRELILVDPEGESGPAVQRLVELVNRTAGRGIGHYEREGEVKSGDTALDSPSKRELARQERMKREG